MAKSKEEKGLLAKLASGILDGWVGDTFTSGKTTYGKYIKNGEPISYREGESRRFFNGEENIRLPGRRIEEHYDTDDKKLLFLQKFGWLINDDDVRSYSAKFKPKNKS